LEGSDVLAVGTQEFAQIIISTTGVDRGELHDPRRSFRYRSDRTPRLDIVPHGGRPGASLYFHGFFRISWTDNTLDDFDILIGGARCDPDAELNADFAATESSPSSTLHYRVRCTAPEQLEPGQHNISFRASDERYGFGKGVMAQYRGRVDLDTGREYHYTAHPHIDSVSAHVGGVNGGGLVRIRGRGFSNLADASATTVVTLAGVPCEVVSADREGVVCRAGGLPGGGFPPLPPHNVTTVPAASEPAMVVGGRGFEHSIYPRVAGGFGSSWDTSVNPAYPSRPTRRFTNTHALMDDERNQGSSFSTETTGWFVPPLSANYTFLMRGDDYHYLEMDLSGGDRLSGLRTISGCGGYEPDWLDCGHMESPKAYLEAGRPVLFRTRHAESGGGDFFEVAVRIHLEELAREEARAGRVPTAGQAEGRRRLSELSSWEEEQRVSVESNVRREKQRITLSNTESGLWTLSASVNGKTETSERLQWDAEWHQVRDAGRAVYRALSVPNWQQVDSCTRTEVREDVFEPALNATVANMLLGHTWECTLDAPSAADWPALTPRTVSLRARTQQRPVVVKVERTQTRSRVVEGTLRVRVGPPMDVDAELARRTAAGDANVTREALVLEDGARWSAPFSVTGSDGNFASALREVGVEAEVNGWGYVDDGRNWRVRVRRPAGDVPLIHLDTSRVSGDLANVSGRVGWAASVSTDGSTDPFVQPLPADWIRSAAPVHADRASVAAANAAVMGNRSALGARAFSGAVVVSQRGVLASCDSFLTDSDAWPRPAPNCEYTYAEGSTPVVTGVAVSRAASSAASNDTSPVTAGDVITVTGSGFLPVDPASPRLFPNGTDVDPEWYTLVTLGGRPASCNLTSATPTAVTCSVMAVPAGPYVVRVVVGKGRGRATLGAGLGAAGATVTYQLRADAVAPAAASSLAGGLRLAITGSGFAGDAASLAAMTVTVGGRPCPVLASTPTEAACATPSFLDAPPTGPVPVVVAVAAASATAQAGTLAYSDASTADVHHVWPAAISDAFSGEVRINTTAPVPRGAADASALEAAVTVAFGGRPCAPRSVSDEGILTCQLSRSSATATVAAASGVAVPRSPAAQAADAALSPVLTVAGRGLARIAASARLDTQLRLESVAPAAVSLLGGAVLTLTGRGFALDATAAGRGDEKVRIVGSVLGGPDGNRSGLVTADCAVLAAAPTSITCRLAAPVFPGWFVAERSSLPATTTAVALAVNGVPVPSACAPGAAAAAPCTVTLDPASTPRLASATFDAAAATMTLAGSGFVSAADLSVTIGGRDCAVASATDTTAVCAVADDREGTVAIVVTVKGRGTANHTSAEPLTHTHDLVLASVDLAEVSRAGGALVTVRGYGFDPSALAKHEVLVLAGGPRPARVVSATHRSLTIEAPSVGAGSSSTAATVFVTLAPRDDANAAVVLERRTRALAAASRRNGGRLLSSDVPASAHPLHGADLHQELLATPAHHAADPDASLHLEGAPVLRLTGEQVRVALEERHTAMRSHVDPILAASRARSLAASAAHAGPGAAPVARRPSARALAASAGWSPDSPRGIVPVPADGAPGPRSLAAAQPKQAVLPAAFSYVGGGGVTPSVTSVAPSSGQRGTVITVLGSGLLPAGGFGAPPNATLRPGVNASRSLVTVGGAPCAVTNVTGNWTDGRIQCTVGDAYGGSHAVDVYVDGKGRAFPSSSARFDASSSLDAVTAPAAVSYRGGGHVTLRGHGFPTIRPGAAGPSPSLSFCGSPCKVVSSSYDEMVCAAGNVTTRAAVAGLWDELPSPLVGESYFGERSNDNPRLAVDGDPSTRYDPGSRNCLVGMDMGASTRAVVTRVRFFPVHRETETFSGAVFQGAASADGPWTDITTVTGRVQEGWNWKELIQIPGVSDTAPEGLPPSAVAAAASFRFLRVVAKSGVSRCAMEVEFLGFAVSAEADAAGGSCAASFALPAGTAPGASPVALDSRGFLLNYTVDATPRVTGISPNNGTALGGTEIRVTGTGFAAAAGAPARVTIAFNGVPCTVTAVDAAGATCVTGRRDRIRPVAVSVTVGGAGLAAVNTSLVYFRYLDRWSQLNTWLNKQPPVAGDTVIVPYGQAVLMDVSPPRLFLFLIEGEVIFDRRDLTLDATYVWVNGGRLEVGTEAEPFLHRATITLHGDRWKDVELPGIGSKVLAVTDRNMGQTRRTKDGFVVIPTNMGHLDIHGRPRIRSWCKIGLDAVPGSRDLHTAEDVDWGVGDRLVVTPSSTNYRHAEELEVAEVVGPRHVRLKEPFLRLHRSQIIDGSPYGHSDVDMRAAVGLLSRNVVIQGDEGSRAQYFGAHTMAMNGGIYRIENAEIRECGQGFILGRYCTHHHMSGAIAARSYVSSNSIHHSNQRIATIHGTRYYTVKHNVGYHVHGHSVFVEDGAERWNRIEENLILWTLKCFSCLKSDTMPANFWMAGPSQYHRHNYAGGSASEGFWYELPGTPHGPSSTPTVCPVHDHVGEFFNNTATAASVHGLRLYPTVLPRKDPCDASSGPLPQYYVNFTSFRNGGHGIFGKKNGDLHHINPKLVENSGDDLFWTKLQSVNYDDNPHIVNLLAIAQAEGTYTGRKVGLFGPQNEYFYVKGATFVNYGEAGAISSCAKCDSHTDMKQGGFTARFEGLRFVNSPRRVKWTAPYKQIFWDLDGTLTDQPGTGGWLTPYWAFNVHAPACRHTGRRQDGGDGLKYDGGIVCDDSVVVRRMQMDSFSPNELQHQALAVTSPGIGTQDVTYREKEIGGWVFPAVAGKDYSLFFRSPIDWRQYDMRYSEPVYVGSHAARHGGAVAEHVRLHTNWTDYRDHIEVHYPTRPAADTYATERLPTDRGYVRGDASDPGPAPAIETTPRLPGSGVIQGPVRMPDPARDQIGTGKTNRTTRDHWYVINTVNATETGSSQRHRVSVYAVQCPRVGERKGTTCDTAAGPDYGAAAELWSSASAWDDGVVPADGANVVIPASRNIILDRSVDVGDLRVLGQLNFALDKDLTLRAYNIEVRGRMRVGSEGAPYLRKAEIVLRGTRTSPSAPIIHDKLWLGNKVLSVVGRLEMVGARVAVPWTRLARTAAKGATTIALTQAVDWRKGDRITLTPTEYDHEQLETAEIASVSGSALEVSLTAPLAHSHFSGDVDVDGSRKERLAAAVGMLSRNIVFRGEMPAAGSGFAAGEDYGAHMYVAEVPNPEPLATWLASGKAQADWRQTVHTGSVLLSGVEFRDNGQTRMEAERAGLYFEYALASKTLGNPVNVVRECAFSDSHNYGIFARGTRHLRLLGNVLHRAARSAIDLNDGCTNATLRDNLVAGVRRSPDAASGWTVPRGGIVLDAVPAEASGNVVGGSHDAGFIVRMPWCPAPGVSIPGGGPFSNNEAHGTVVGAFLLSDVAGQPKQTRCRQWSSFVAWKSSHLAVVTVDQTANVVLDNVRVYDSHIGISLNFFRLGTTASYAHVVNSVIGGSTGASSTCDASVVCRAVGESGGAAASCRSVLGTAFRRAGLMTSQYTNRGKTCEHDFLPFCYPKSKPERMCSMPWEKRYGLPGTRHAELHVRDTVFTHFGGDNDCGAMSRAVVHNPTQVDYAPPMHFSGIKWHLVPQDARFHFRALPSTDAKCANGCDGFFFLVVNDKDGTTTGTAGGSVIGNNPELAAASPFCEANARWPGFRCPGALPAPAPYTLRNFVFESTDFADRGHRRIGPLKVERAVPGTARSRNVTSIGPIDDSCAKRFFFSQYNHAAQPGLRHDMRFAATVSSTMRLHYFSSDPAEAVLAALFVQRPNVIDIFVDGRPVTMNTNARVPTLASPDGEYIFNPQARTLFFTMRGNAAAPQRRYDIRRRPAIQLNMTLSVSVEEFVADQLVQNLAVLLSIPASRIRVVDVQPGSVAVTTAIVDEQEPSTDPAETVAQVKRLATVAKRVITEARKSDFSASLGFQVQAMGMDISRPSIVEAPQDGGNSNDTNFNASALTASGLSADEAAALAPPSAGVSALEAELRAFLKDEGLPDNSDIPDEDGTDADEGGAGGGGGGLVLIAPAAPPAPAADNMPLIIGLAVGFGAAFVVAVGILIALRYRNGGHTGSAASGPAAKASSSGKTLEAGGPEVEVAGQNPAWSKATRGAGKNPSLRNGDIAPFGGAGGLQSASQQRGGTLLRSGEAGSAAGGTTVRIAPPPGRAAFGPRRSGQV